MHTNGTFKNRTSNEHGKNKTYKKTSKFTKHNITIKTF